MKAPFERLLLPAGLLSGTIIGAGIFSLPFVFNKTGFLFGCLYLLLGTFAYVTLHLMFSDVMLQTEGEHRLVGYIRMYLGKFAFYLSIITSVLASFFVLT